jgi:8-oxo-dGTP pyrophosphatase MutT (NUDIX family)
VPAPPPLTDGTVDLRPVTADATAEVLTYTVEHRGTPVGEVSLDRSTPDTAALHWRLERAHRGRGYAARAVRVLADWALTEAGQGGLGVARVEALVEADNAAALRVATRSGLRREGVRRVVPDAEAETSGYVVLARLATDPPLSDPVGFRSLLNSFLPRKRAIAQLLVRDHDGRVLLCQLTYKRDWDLPGGVVEVGESPRLAAAREVAEELGLDVPAGDLLLTDWLPPWGGWDDAVCLVFDGGRHDASILEALVRQEREIRSAEFCTPAEVEERCADFTARRIAAAVSGDGRSSYTESGRA